MDLGESSPSLDKGKRQAFKEAVAAGQIADGASGESPKGVEKDAGHTP